MLKYRVYKKDEFSEWVVFIHGLGSSINTWVKQVRDFKEYHNLLLIDLHGHGSSRNIRLKNSNNPSFEEINNDIINVLDALNIESAHFIGISIGTIVVNSITLTHPDRIKSVIMGGAVIKIDLKLIILLKFILVFKLFNKKWIHDILFKVTFPEEDNKKKMKSFSSNLKKLNSITLHYWASIIYLMKNRFKNKDYTIIPTLFIMGEEDKILIRNIVENIEGASIHIIQNATHLCHLDSSKIFNDVSLAFLKNYKTLGAKETIDFKQKLDKKI